MLKKMMIGLMSLVMALGIFLVTIQAEELQEGDYKYQVLEDGTAEITGYTGTQTELVLPDKFGECTVTSIGERAFEKCSKVTGVKIPEGVTSIGDQAFYDCTSLSHADIPEGVASIGEEAFRRCSNLSSVTIPESVRSIGKHAFNGTKLSKIKIPDGMTDIDDYAFCGCASLSHVDIPDGVTSIGAGAFLGCSSLSSVTIPESVKSIGESAFHSTNLSNINIPKGVTYIGRSTFAYCINLRNVNIPDGVTGIGENAFGFCTSLSHITIPDGVTSIGRLAFRGSGDLKSIAIPESVKSIGDQALLDCYWMLDIYYGGDQDAWETIDIQGEHNEKILSRARKHYNAVPFDWIRDIGEKDWFYDAVYYVCDKGIMTGMNDISFAPLDPLTRAQFAVILHRMEGEQDAASDKRFDDVEDKSWYTKAVLWAYENGVVTGYDNANEFGPHDNISREQLAVMMYRYAKSKGFDVETDADLSVFKDAKDVSDYAQEAMKWAVGNGIITGKTKGTRLDPNGNALRAECATIIQRYIEKHSQEI